ncbi:YgiT-type zinc finger protein [Polyangium aurulentum]|uniref:YgiT-type zinc finger protein n=1 Tax=Polyangium aurulentum TaxID=2567896 RepID=UPI00146D8929|nr:YgiT-type zinc finger protein [Polyangium aurulentum]UQA62467.1 YgiT-type zinc finger protein [Polyangium aurulentum]
MSEPLATKAATMLCMTCGGDMEDRITDLPFKLGDHSIVIVNDVPVLQCPHCHAYLMRAPVMAQIERLLESTSQTAELAILRYAA